MSKLSPAQTEALNTLAPLVGERIPGGCDHCDAFQTVEPLPGSEGRGWMIDVHHDDWCPLYNRMRGKGQAS